MSHRRFDTKISKKILAIKWTRRDVWRDFGLISDVCTRRINNSGRTDFNSFIEFKVRK